MTLSGLRDVRERARGNGCRRAGDRSLLLRFMTTMRAAEERGLALYKQGKVPGSFYDGRGQEAICVGAAYALGPGIGCASCTATSAPISSAG